MHLMIPQQCGNDCSPGGKHVLSPNCGFTLITPLDSSSKAKRTGWTSLEKQVRVWSSLHLNKPSVEVIKIMATQKQPAGIGTRDKNGRTIAVGDIVQYMAGSRRHIPQEYLVEDVPAPDIFHAMEHDGRLQ